MTDDQLSGGIGRQHVREHVALRVVVTPATGAPLHGLIDDVSVSGIKITGMDAFPAGTPVTVSLPEISFTATATVIRVYRRIAECLVAMQFDREHPELTGKLVEYKIRRQ